MKRLPKFAMSLCLALGLLTTWGASTGTAAAERQVWSPSSLHDALHSVIASDGKRLWLATTGQNRKGDVSLELLEFAGKRWQRLGGRMPSTSNQNHFLTLLPGKRSIPCLGDHEPRLRTPRIRCFQQGEWRALTYPSKFRKSELGAFATRDGRLEASFVNRGGSGGQPTFQLTQVRFGPRGARVITPTIRLKGLWHGEPVSTTRRTDDEPLRVDLWDANSGRRMVMTYSGGRWKRSAVDPGSGPAGGPRGSHAVLDGRTIVAPFADNLREEFYGGRRESTLRLSLKKLGASGWRPVVDGPIDSGEGSGQGGVFPVGNRIWSVWMEHDYEGVAFGGMLPTRYRAVRLNRSLTGIDRKIELWSGDTYFPGSLQATEYRGKVAFLYMRQAGPGSGNRPTVDLRFRSGSGR